MGARIDYDAIQAVNWSTLKRMHVSALLCKYRSEHPEPDKRAFELGRLIHVATLEPDRWASDYVAQPDFGDQRFKENKAAKKEWLDTIPPSTAILSAADHALAERCAEAIRNHRVAGPLIRGGRAEVVAEWTDPITAVKCKARIDYVPLAVIELKSTRRHTLRLMCCDAAEFLYHGQLAWYHDGAIEARLIPPNADGPYVVAVQTCEPYDVVPFNVLPETLEAGRNLYRELLDRYVQCKAANYWPGLAPDFVPLELPPYAAGVEREAANGEEW